MSKRLLISSGVSSAGSAPCKSIRYRAFHLTRRRHAAQEFSMPAMSPTMTEGNITNWKINEGDKFSAGDVLLEIETDKAQMDVEAQDDGIMARIIKQTGAKGVRVGTRIAITAEPEDNLQELNLESFNVGPTSTKSQNSESQNPSPKSQGAHDSSKPSNESANKPVGKHGQYPFFPSVVRLLHQNKITASEAVKIPTSGPQGRLLKGDILAYLGIVDSDYPDNQSKRIQNLGHLDLSGIEGAVVAKDPSATSTPRISHEEIKDTLIPTRTDVTLPVSLTAVREVRERLQNILGVDMSIETFVARAALACNKHLSQSKRLQTTADDLFNAILGMDELNQRFNDTNLTPRIQFAEVNSANPIKAGHHEKNIIDELISSPKAQSQATKHATPNNVDNKDGWLSVTVSIGDEARAKAFLQRLKTLLQTEPGRLVL